MVDATERAGGRFEADGGVAMNRVPKMGLLAGSAAFAGLGVAGAVHGQVVIYVDASRPANGDGTSWGQAFSDLQDAFDSLASLEPSQLVFADIQFRVASGTYRPHSARSIAFWLDSGATASAVSISVEGGYGGVQSPTPDARDFVNMPTILSADRLANDGPNFENQQDNSHVVLCSATNVDTPYSLPVFRLSGLTLEGAQSGSGFLFRQNELTIEQSYPITWYQISDCVFRNNTADSWGGGMSPLGVVRWSGARVHIDRCTFTGNRGSAGGGASFGVYDDVEIHDSTFTNNYASFAGGGFAFDGTILLDRVQVSGNSAAYYGGGIYQWSDLQHLSWARLSNSLISDNQAGAHGGGAYLRNAEVQSCTFAHNSGTFGGGVFFTGNRLPIFGSILARNSASSAGAQLAGGGDAPYMLEVCIEEGSSGCYFPFNPFPLTIRYATAEFRSPAGPDDDPMTWQDNDYRLHPRSPLIDAYEGDTPFHRDLLGEPREVQGILGRGLRSDLGCYESQLTLCPTDLDADGGVTIDDFLDFLQAFELGQSLADLTTNGLTPFPDGAVTVDDLLFFLAKYEQGC
jgi:hypothetical protein